MIRGTIRFWNRYFLPIDLILSAAIVGGLVTWDQHYGGAPYVDGLLASNRGPVYSALTSVCGALLGFVLATLTILLGFAPSETFRQLRKSPHYPTLWSTYTSAIRWLAGATIVAFVALIADRDTSFCRPALYVAVAVTLVAGFRLARSVWILEKVVDLVAKRREAIEDSEPKPSAKG
jgi:hypothetical protein